MASKFDFAVILATIACGVLSIEHGNYTFTGVPTRAERSTLAAAAACPDKDTLPYPASCLEFLEGKLTSEVRRWRAAETQPAAVKDIDGSISPEAACPDKDTVPYSESCIRFLSGWFWRVEVVLSAPVTPPERQNSIGSLTTGK